MPPGRRTIPRAGAPRRSRRTVTVGDLEVSPALAKAAGELIALGTQIRACEACERASPSRSYGTGYPRAPVMLVAEHPEPADLEAEGSFTQEAEALDKAFDALGIPLSWVYGATAVRCGSDPATSDQLLACSTHLLVEIEAVEPQVIVAFGPRAVESVRTLHGRCGLSVPDEVPQGEALSLRAGLVLVSTEPMPAGVTQRDAKRRLWRDLQLIPGLLTGAVR
jgi:uracil-DNA glycosylase family 4